MKLFFFHLPKCGGTSLTALLDQKYHIDEIAPYGAFGSNDSQLTPESTKPHVKLSKEYNFIRGHFPYSVFTMLCEGFNTLTMLRSPKERLISAINHWQKASNLNHPNDTIEIKRRKQLFRTSSIDQLLTSRDPWLQSILNNAQVRQLGGLPLSNKSSQDLLEPALRHLDEFNLVTILERYNESIRLICKFCDIISPAQSSILNVGDKLLNLESFSTKTRKLLDKYTMYDEILYSHGLDIFMKQQKEINQIPEERCPSQCCLTTFSATMNDPIRGTGWHTREGTKETGLLRWTGPSQVSTLHTNLKAEYRYRFRLSVAGAMDSEILHGTKLRVGNQIQELSLEVIESEQFLSASISNKELSHDTVSIIEIITPKVISHHDLDPVCPDKRKKGLLVKEICIEPLV